MSNLIYRKHMISMKLKSIKIKRQKWYFCKSTCNTLNENLPEKQLRLLKENGKTVDVKVKQNKQTDWSEDKLNNITLKSRLVVRLNWEIYRYVS